MYLYYIECLILWTCCLHSQLVHDLRCCRLYRRYDPQTNRWARAASMSTRRLGVGVAVLNGYLYAVGGSDGTSPLNTGLCKSLSTYVLIWSRSIQPPRFSFLAWWWRTSFADWEFGAVGCHLHIPVGYGNEQILAQCWHDTFLLSTAQCTLLALKFDLLSWNWHMITLSWGTFTPVVV